MKFSVAAALAGLLATPFVSAFDLSSVQRTAGPSNAIPLRYIVEFDSTAHLSAAGLSRRAATPHEAVYAEIAERGLSITSLIDFNSNLFVGASIKVANAADLESLLSITGVIAVRPVQLITIAEELAQDFLSWKSTGHTSTSAPSSTKTSSPTGTSVTVVTTTACSTGANKKSTCTAKTVTSTPSPTSTKAAYPTSGWSVLSQIQADRVQAKGVTGKGIKIAIVDSGIDYTRTPLGGCFGTGCKVAGGYDYVGDDYTGSNTPQPDNDPYDGCYGHGTFVGGIIGANANEYNVTGVAPDATLYAYRIFSCSGATSDDIAMQAVQDAYNAGVDVINLSWGDISAWTESFLSVLASRIMAAGTMVSVSVGNEGQIGSFYPNTPADGLGVLSVGSSDNAIFPVMNAVVNTSTSLLPYYSLFAFPTGTYPLVMFSTTGANDGCTVPATVPDYSGKVVIVTRGACSLLQKAENAYATGAVGIFVINTDANTIPYYYSVQPYSFAVINYNDGQTLVSQIQAGQNPTATFSFAPGTVPNTFTANTTSYYSSIGPTNDLYMSPSLVAPGSYIVSLLPAPLGNWTIDEGTSFSSAFLSGAAALYLAVHPKTSPQTIREAFQYTSTQLPVSLTNSQLESVAAQGAGKLQLYDAIYGSTLVSPGQVYLNDTAYFAGSQSITIKNTGSSIIKYTASHLAAGTMLAYAAGVNQSNDEPVPQASNAATVKISPSSFTVWPGFSQTVQLTFTPPTGLSAQQVPVYSGWIAFSGGSSPITVPYLGVAAAMKGVPVLDSSSAFFGFNAPVILDASGNVQSGSETYSAGGDTYPTILYRLVGGSPALTIDLVSSTASLNFTPTYTTKRSLVPRATSTSSSSVINWLICLFDPKNAVCTTTTSTGKTNTFQSVPLIGNIYSATYLPRNTDNADGAGNSYVTYGLAPPFSFSNGTSIPNGSYRFLMRALHITGDATQESDYESWLSQPFTLTA